MVRSPEEKAAIGRFARTYALHRAQTMRAIERKVCGCDYGGTSWTTLKEAEQVVADLALKRGDRLLDVGAGAGWPGLYFARRLGCDVVLTDLPMEGLEIARERADAEGLSGTCTVALADGAALPFPDCTFDAIHHSDVLCCVADKAGVLRECRRVLRRGGEMLFSVIHVGRDLTERERDEAAAVGPPFVLSDMTYEALLAAAGWRIKASNDLTPDYLQATQSHIQCLEDYRAELMEIHSDEEIVQMLTRRRACAHAIEKGLLRRSLFRARPMGGRC
jgi:ubiquinone/menaquinone biosynthesis C-methylase UbiE